MACPRCGSPDTAKIADSPVPGVWEAFRCQGCNYVWRNTEDLAGIRRYDDKLAERARSRQSWPPALGDPGATLESEHRGSSGGRSPS